MSRPVDKVVVHSSATPPSMDVGVREIGLWHRYRGFNEVGYNFVIRRNGVIELGRDLEKTPAHVRGYNRTSVGICLIGGIDEEGQAENNFTDEQFKSLRSFLNGIFFFHPELELFGHRDLSPDKNGDGVISEDEYMKECPSFDVNQWYERK